MSQIWQTFILMGDLTNSTNLSGVQRKKLLCNSRSKLQVQTMDRILNYAGHVTQQIPQY